MPDGMGQRLAMLRHLGAARRGPLILWALLRSLGAFLPAATALATAYVIEAAAAGSVAVPLAVLCGILLIGQAAGEFSTSLKALLVAQINGAHRMTLARMVASGPTISALEQPEVQDLVRTAAAEPRDWIEKTPADGALTALETGIRYLGLAGTAAVVATWSPWLVLPVVLAALAVRWITIRQWIEHYRIWGAGITHSRQYLYWGEVSTSPAAGKEIRIFGFGRWLLDKHQFHMRQHLDPVWRDDRRAAKVLVVRFLLTVVPLAVVYYVVARGVPQGHGSLAAAAAVFTACWGIFTGMGGSAQAIDIEGSKPVVRASGALRQRLAETVTQDRVPPGGADVAVSPTIRFDEVSFRYQGAARPVLTDLTLEIRPGELLAVVGLNGAGKSTLTKLLCGLYRPCAGQITADGQDIAGMADWQSRLAVVFQDFLRYPLSLRENVVLGRADQPLDEAALSAASKAAGLDDLIDRLPAGWDTPLDRSRTGGVDLSGGQWQKVALARALYAVGVNARLLLLDEPTAHLDVRSEFDLFQRLTEATRSVSTVLITHRLWTVRHVDRIVLLQGGRVAESGSHDELMTLDGDYAAMYRLQAERFVKGFDDRIEDSEVAA